MQKLYGDNGILATHFNSMLYLQIMMDLDLGAENHPFTLPNNFPEAWTSNPAMTAQFKGSSSSSSTDGNRIMELSTSGIQKRVSTAFDRIDFGHVDEYLLTMQDLVDAFGIQMAPLPIEILSLDIANIDSKIGVEVDGPGHWVSNIDPKDSRDLLSGVGAYRPSGSGNGNGEGNFDYRFEWNSEDQTINGSTSLKLRMFDHMGWNIINIPFWEWYPVDKPSLSSAEKTKAQEEYCRSLLSKQS